MKVIDRNRKIISYELTVAFLLCLLWVILTFSGKQGFTSVLFADEYDSFMDFFNCIAGYNANPFLGEYPTNYPPMAVLLFMLFRNVLPEQMFTISPHEMKLWQAPIMLYFILTMLEITLVTYTYQKKIKTDSLIRGLFLCVMFFSFPALFAFERGNIINLAFALTVYYIGFYSDENIVRRHSAFLALAVAASIKIYPAVFAILLLKEKKMKDALILLGYGLAAFFLPFWSFGGIPAIQGFFRGITAFARSRSVACLGNDIWIVSEKAIASIFSNAGHFANVMPDSYGYNFSIRNIVYVFQTILGDNYLVFEGNLALIFVVAVLLLYIFLARTKWQVSLGCSLLIILVPSFSGAYVLLFLAIPIALYIHEVSCRTRIRKSDWRDWCTFTLLLLLCIPFNLPEIQGFQQEFLTMTFSYLIYFVIICYILYFSILEVSDILIKNAIIKRVFNVSLFAMTLFYTVSIVICAVIY